MRILWDQSGSQSAEGSPSAVASSSFLTPECCFGKEWVGLGLKGAFAIFVSAHLIFVQPWPSRFAACSFHDGYPLFLHGDASPDV